MTSSISASPASSDEVGSCNGCTANVTADGAIKHTIWVIQLRGASVRVCETCRAELLRKLGADR